MGRFRWQKRHDAAKWAIAQDEGRKAKEHLPTFIDPVIDQ
jgi:hypothetical protein